MQISFYKCNSTWNMKIINEVFGTETITCFDNTVTNEHIIDIALTLGKGDNVETLVDFTERN